MYNQDCEYEHLMVVCKIRTLVSGTKSYEPSSGTGTGMVMRYAWAR